MAQLVERLATDLWQLVTFGSRPANLAPTLFAKVAVK